MMNNIDVNNSLGVENKQTQSGSTYDKQQWLKVLEGSGLYTALEAFEVVNNTGAKNNNKSQTGAAKDASTLNQEQAQYTDTSSGLARNTLHKKPSSDGVQQAIYGHQKIAKANQPANLDRANFVQRNTSNKPQALSSSVTRGKDAAFIANPHIVGKWLSKITTVTIAQSAVEVWVRDSSLSENKLTHILNQIKRSMAQLGVSLSKVTINGKTAFESDNTLEVKSWR